MLQKIISTMARNNYLEPDKVMLAKWVDKALLQSLKKEIIKSGLKVCKIWSLNLTTMVGKFGPNEVFITTKKEEEKKNILIRCNRRFQQQWR
jgi:hypothetical protein